MKDYFGSKSGKKVISPMSKDGLSQGDFFKNSNSEQHPRNQAALIQYGVSSA